METGQGQSSKKTPIIPVITVLGLLAAVYALADFSLTSILPANTAAGNRLSSTAVGSSTQGATGGTGTTGGSTTVGSGAAVAQNPQGVSSAVVKQITESLKDVKGLNELVVLPAQTGSGVTVSAMVDLADYSLPQSQWSPVVQSDVQAFFNEVYQSGENVQNAQVYFTVNQKVVAGAGLGSEAYKKLSSETATGQSGFTQALASAPTVTNQSTLDSWFQTQTTPNAP